MIQMFNNKDYKYFNLAKRFSELSDFPRIHIGSISVYKNKILSGGFNSLKSHPAQLQYNKFRNIQSSFKQCEYWQNGIHAELMCILQLRYMDIDFSKIKLYVYRQRLDGKMGICRPCNGCIQAIKSMGIRHIYYTSDSGFIYEKT